MADKASESKFVERMIVQDVFTSPQDAPGWRKKTFQELTSPSGMFPVSGGGMTKAIKPCAAVLRKQVSSESFDLDSSSGDMAQDNRIK